ncbi:uncharacterized protein LOC115990093 [Quercus lobata]|uniref:uncharacterized protein LOC115990093 n=1 Tax=Quercus lobata TaxID=97700 RepID=UPI001244A08D|nr:uncharacterized protein LOC115990093 [Quercus lobata]
MEEILNDWKRFSLLEEEDSKVTLDDENNDAKEVILAGKFMTRRVLSIEAVGRTLKPLWKTKNGFEIRDVGNHVLLFVFDNEEEAERVLAAEPWTYDKHLIILSRYDGSCSVQKIRFHTVKFWVQLHGLPVNKLNERTAYGIGRSIGEVSRASQSDEIIGGNFLRIRVGINATRPLSRGRKVLIGNGKEVWVSFKYEKMPNFCYWCGMVSHDAKECKVWLSSKGSLSLDQQEYGSWLRADPFSVGKKSFMFVPGTGGDFGGEDTNVRTGRETEERIQGAAPPQEAGTNRVDIASSEGNLNSVSPGITATFTQTSHAGKILDCPESLPNVVPLNVHTDMVDFEAQIQEIDMELNKYDNNGTCTANSGFMAELSPSLSNYSVQEHAHDKSSHVTHNVTHDSSNEPRDSEGSQLGLRT